MPKFRYIGPAEYTTAGIAGARFIRLKINEVSDERLAAQLRASPETFEEVPTSEVPETPAHIAMPTQGDPHPDPRVSAILRDNPEEKVRKAGEKTPKPGNLARDDQREANTEALAERVEEAQELADKPAKKAK
jgi:hypothetical protein